MIELNGLFTWNLLLFTKNIFPLKTMPKQLSYNQKFRKEGLKVGCVFAENSYLKCLRM